MRASYLQDWGGPDTKHNAKYFAYTVELKHAFSDQLHALVAHNAQLDDTIRKQAFSTVTVIAPDDPFQPSSGTAFSIAGGGDTLAAIDKYGVADQISYISTGGGAFLEFVEGKVLPAVEVLETRAKG